MVQTQRAGGSFAPPIDDVTLAHYRQLTGAASPPVREAIESLAKLVEHFHETPASTLKGTPHPSGMGQIVPLHPAEVERIWDHVPWDHELDGIQRLFDAIPASQKDLRNAAFHLLWYAKELAHDREPITQDKLKG